MVAPIRFLSGRQQQQKIGIEGSTEEQKVLEVVGRVGIGTTIFDADYNLDVRGSANISGILSVGQIISGAGNSFTDLYVTGLSTFQDDVNIGFGGTTAFFNVSTGNIGVGTDNPSQKLDVVGNTNIAGTLSLNAGANNPAFIKSISQFRTAGIRIGHDFGGGGGTGVLFTNDANSTLYGGFGSAGLHMPPAASIGWFSTASVNTTSQDLSLFRDAADVLAQRRGTNAQTFRIYNTYTSASQYERAYLGWNNNTFEIGVGTAGISTARSISLVGAAGSNTGDTLQPLQINQTWTAGSGIATALTLDVTDTSSSSSSKLLDLRVGGSPKFQVDKSGAIYFQSKYGTTGTETGAWFKTSNSGGIRANWGNGGGAWIFGGVDTNNSILLDAGSGGRIGFATRRVVDDVNFPSLTDVWLYRDDAGVLAQRNAGAGQTFRIYNTYTSSTNFERAQVGWTTDVFIVGTEKGVDGGSPRQLELQTDGTTRVAITTDGYVGIGTTNPTTKLQVGSTFDPQVIGFGTVQGYASPSTNVLIGDENTGSSLTPQVGGAWKGLDNNFIGAGAGAATTTGNGNNFFGQNAGCSNTSGSYNNFFGLYAGCSNTTGNNNNFFGNYGAGTSNTTGNDNNFFGYSAGKSNTTGSCNNFFGNYAGQYNTTGLNNNFFGNYAGRSNTTGSCNNFFGRNAGIANTIGRSNNFFGESAGCSNTWGCFNNFIGYFAGEDNTTGQFNNFIGYLAGSCNTTGSNNTFFGSRAGMYSNTGSYNVHFGASAGQNEYDGNYNIFLGSFTGVNNFSTPTSNKIIIGRGTNSNRFDGPVVTKSTQLAIGIRTSSAPSKYWLVGDENFNVGIGTTNPKVRLQIDGVLGFGTFTGAYGTSTNIRIGDETTGADLTTGSNNIFMGIGAGKSTTSGIFDNFIGYDAGKNNTAGEANSFFGAYSGTSNTDGGFNSFIGHVSGVSNTTGALNTFVGAVSGQNNTTGSYNSFFGEESGYNNTIGNYNSLFGEAAGFYNTTGSNNIFLGAFTGISTSSSGKVLIGYGNNFSNYFDAPNTTKDTQLAIGIRTSSAPSKYWLVGDENFNVGIGTTNPTSKLTVDGDISNSYTTYGTITSSASTLSPVGIHSALPVATYRSVEYFIQATTGSRYQAVKLLSIHDGSTAYNTTYGEIFSDGSISTFDVDISGGNVRLVATASTDANVSYIVNYTTNKI